MAEIAYTKTDQGPFYKVYTWTGVTQADTFAPVKLEKAVHAYSVQVIGTFGGAIVAIHGSMAYGGTYSAMVDPGGTQIGLTAAGITSMRDLAFMIKPVATGGSGQSLTVHMIVNYLQ